MEESKFYRQVQSKLHLPTGEVNTRSRSNDSTNKNETRNCKTSDISTFLLLLLGISLCMIFYSKFSLQSVDDEVSLLISSRGMSDTLQGFEEHAHRLRQQLSDLDIAHQAPQGPKSNLKRGAYSKLFPNEPMEDIKSMQSHIKTLSEKSDNLKAVVQEYSREEVMHKYGPGRHKVEIELDFPDESPDGPNKFVIELAPLDLMPHSVHFFLDIVSYGLLDGCSFIMNALHVLKAAPLPYDGSSASAKARAFVNHGLESIAFKEYSDDYPHKAYTVGFAADGSPSFYINTEDNTEVHAGDPSFGQIISGFDAVQRLEEEPIRHGIWFKHRIGIKHARILPAPSNN